MQTHSPHTPHLQHLWSDLHLESHWTSAVELFCRNSQRVLAIDCFRRGAPSGITQGNLDLLQHPNFPDSHHQSQIQ